MTQNHKLKVRSVQKTTADCAVIDLDIPKELQDQFKFKQGQHLTFIKDIDGEEIRRSYSLCTSPSEKKWMVAVKKLEGGKFSTFANEVLEAGDDLETMIPNGNFFVPVDPTLKRNYVAFAAGSGITPILSIIKTHLESEPLSKFELFYSNRDVKSIILKEEIEGLKNNYMERFEINYFLTKQKRLLEIFNGRIDDKKLDAISENLCDFKSIDHFFLCGPKDMVFCIKEYLEKNNIDPKKIHFELFNSGETIHKTVNKVPLEDYKGKVTTATIIEGNKSIEVKLKTDIDYVLDAALAQGADLPFACKGGVCCTCKAKLIEGEVEMDVNYALEPEEVAEGYILTCQSKPKSEKIVVNFDVT